MANWQTVAELQDISADLPHFTQALTELSTRLGLDITGLEADHISCVAIKIPLQNAGVVGLNSAVNCCQKTSLTADLFVF
jgi:predicted metalloenzyme YecM